jgi:predicted DNA-binding antitoxin AbrB/MazE fold protein
MSQTLEAVFEDGTFKPVGNGSLPFSEGHRVQLTVEVPAETQDDLLGLAGRVYEGLSDKDIDEVERIALDHLTNRSEF